MTIEEKLAICVSALRVYGSTAARTTENVSSFPQYDPIYKTVIDTTIPSSKAKVAYDALTSIGETVVLS